MHYVLEKGEVLTLITKPEMEAVTVVSGRIWLTRHGDAADYCLRAGAVHTVSSAGRVVIEALEKTAVSVIWRQAPAALRVAVIASEAC